ncbi:MAG: PPC domain-containing DNA-binding protein [Candidatus Eisenbacteria bacterium]
MKFSKTEFGYVLVLGPNDEIVSSIGAFARSVGVGSAVVSGIGAAGDLVIGYFDRQRKTYVKRQLEGEYEILSLTGTVSHFEGNPWVHVHVVASGPDFSVVGGHLFSGRVTVTLETVVNVSAGRIERKEDAESGFKFLDLERSV